MRLYFDECCSRRMAGEIKQFFSEDYPDLHTAHVLEFYSPGAKDSKWLKALEEDRSWIVLTQDLGRGRDKEKLPLICKDLKITHVCFTPFMIRAGYSIQKRAIVSKWSDIIKLQALPRGTRAQLTGSITNEDSHRFELRIFPAT